MQSILIIGASSGIGRSCARLLSSNNNNRLILVARRIELLEELKKELNCMVECIQFDISDTENIKTIFDACKAKGILLDAMVYCAGMDSLHPIKSLNYNLMDSVMRVNLYGFIESVRYFANSKYSNQYSKIVAISSSASVSNDKGMAIYSASKAAMNSAVQTMAKEYIKKGILVNAVMPTGVLTPMALSKMNLLVNGFDINIDSEINRLDSNTIPIDEDSDQPFGVISPTYVAKLALFLISDDNKYITGNLIPITAGKSI